MIEFPQCKVAAAHVAPVYFDIDRTVDKVCRVIRDAAQQGVHLIAFPECFIPGYPHWGEVIPPMATDGLFKQMVERGLRINGPEIRRICAAAAENRMVVSIGFNEGTDVSVGCLWNANLLINSDGTVLSHHRKLVPTSVEKLIWASGDGAGLRIADTALGRVGMLICGENTNPLARYTLIAQGEQIHISSYPSVFPAKSPDGKGAYDIEDAIRIRAANHAFEGKLFNIVAATPFDDTARQFLSKLGDNILPLFERGAQSASMIVGPTGKVITSNASAEEGLCVADIDLGDCVAPKRMHDVVGYYNRYDVFNLNVMIKRDLPANITYRRSIKDEELSTPASNPNEAEAAQAPRE